jgi:hypothetical protein
MRTWILGLVALGIFLVGTAHADEIYFNNFNSRTNYSGAPWYEDLFATADQYVKRDGNYATWTGTYTKRLVVSTEGYGNITFSCWLNIWNVGSEPTVIKWRPNALSEWITIDTEPHNSGYPGSWRYFSASLSGSDNQKYIEIAFGGGGSSNFNIDDVLLGGTPNGQVVENDYLVFSEPGYTEQVMSIEGVGYTANNQSLFHNPTPGVASDYDGNSYLVSSAPDSYKTFNIIRRLDKAGNLTKFVAVAHVQYQIYDISFDTAGNLICTLRDYTNFTDNKYVVLKVSGFAPIESLQGPAGPQGEIGLMGLQGAVGPQGIMGEIGPMGLKGDTGPEGQKGDVGPKGDTGEEGKEGVKGDVGLKGDAGAQGEQGMKGEVGLKGDQGDKGETGSKGDIGQQGEAGPKGDVGAKGDMGPQGIKGEIGPQGSKGDTGLQGLPGITPPEVAAMQTQITSLQQQNTDQQKRLEEDRYLLEQLPQLKKKIAELEAQQ